MEYVLKMMCKDFKFTWFKLLTIHKKDNAFDYAYSTMKFKKRALDKE